MNADHPTPNPENQKPETPRAAAPSSSTDKVSPAPQLTLPLNSHGNVDLRQGLPHGVCFLPVGAPVCEMLWAGIPVTQGFLGLVKARGRYRPQPQYAQLQVAPIGWEHALAAWRATQRRVREEEVARAEAEKVAKRRAAAQRAAATRRDIRQLERTALGRLLQMLRRAQKYSDSAKARAANGCRLADYYERDNSYYARANYRRSRRARERDYSSKEIFLKQAVKLAPTCGVPFGWGADEQGAPVLYFELSAGQISFHCAERFEGPTFQGQWDGVRGVSGRRIEEAISTLLSGNTPPVV